MSTAGAAWLIISVFLVTFVIGALAGLILFHR
jgi:hypothetical protein